MSRLLILMRHAQTAVKQAGQHDSDRKLTTEGEAQAMKTGQHFALNSFAPDFVLASSAVRAHDTARVVLESAGASPAFLHTNPNLYEADAATWIACIRSVPDAIRTLLCVGHNPAISGLASTCLNRTLDLPPAGYVVLKSPANSWNTFDWLAIERVAVSSRV